jgi:hypothetical protein
MAHGFPARTPAVLGIEHYEMASREVLDVTMPVANRLRAAADQMAAAQARVGLLLADRAEKSRRGHQITPAETISEI